MSDKALVDAALAWGFYRDAGQDFPRFAELVLRNNIQHSGDDVTHVALRVLADEVVRLREERP